MKHRILLVAAACAVAACSESTRTPVDPIVDPPVPVPAPVKTTYDFSALTSGNPIESAHHYQGSLVLTVERATPAKLAAELKVQACDDVQRCPVRDYLSAAEYTTLDSAGNFESYVYAHDSIGDQAIQLLGRITPDSASGLFAIVGGRYAPQGVFVALPHAASASSDRAVSGVGR